METKPLKPAKFWWLVTVMYLSSFFIAGLLGMVLTLGTSAVMGIDLGSAGLTDTYPLAIQIIFPVCLALTTWNAARYLKRNYVIQNPKRVVIWTLGVYVFLTILGYCTSFSEYGLPNIQSLVSPILSGVIFAVLGNKFLRA